MRAPRWFAVLSALLICATATASLAQRRFAFREVDPDISNPRYDGRYAFARLRYTSGPGGYYYCGGIPPWSHGYFPCGNGQRAETNLMKIMGEISYLDPHVDETVVVAADDPELGRYPVAYLTEPGFWTLTTKEAQGLRRYLLKGGFLIVDDFRPVPYDHGGGGWENFEEVMRQVIPDARFDDLDPSRQIFHSFFEIDSFDIIPQYYDQGRPILRGLFENNDPTKRLMVVVNFNTDISNFWEFSANGFRPIDESNQAYKLGVNYLIYGMTH